MRRRFDVCYCGSKKNLRPLSGHPTHDAVCEDCVKKGEKARERGWRRWSNPKKRARVK